MTGFEKIMMKYISQWDIPGRDRDDPQTKGLENDNNLCGSPLAELRPSWVEAGA